MRTEFNFAAVLQNPDATIGELEEARRVADQRLRGVESDALGLQAKIAAGDPHAWSDLEDMKAEISSARELSKTIDGLIKFRSSRSEVRRATAMSAVTVAQ